ncbi:hypothetical protein [Caldiplasma sukawensis]
MEHNSEKLLIEKLGILSLGIIVLSVPYAIYNVVGYSSPTFIFLEFIINFLGFFIILYSFSFTKSQIFKKIYNYRIPLIVSIVLISLFVSSFFEIREIFTDEIIIEKYAIYSILHFKDPYTVNVPYSYFLSNGLSESSLTPTTVGSIVNSLSYPAMSFLIFLPSVLIGVNPDIVLIFFLFLLILLIIENMRAKQMTYLIPFVVALFFFDINVMIFSFHGITDIIWVTFTALSFIYFRKYKLSGIFFGIALSLKQTPVFLLPFFLYFLYRENGLYKMLKFTFISVLTFLILNLPFILWNPSAYFRDILSPESAQIIGIGFGPSQLSFAGYYPQLARPFFDSLMISFIILLLLLYITKYKNLKFAFPVFPIIIMIFNYRVLENYFIYWPLMAIPFLGEIREYFPSNNSISPSSKNDQLKQINYKLNYNSKIRTFYRRILNRKKILIAIIISICLILPSLVAYQEITDYRSDLHIIEIQENYKQTSSGPYIYEINVTLLYTGGNKNESVFFRILQSGFLTDPNGYIWNVSGTNISNGQIKTFILTASSPLYYLDPSLTYKLIIFDQSDLVAKTIV